MSKLKINIKDHDWRRISDDLSSDLRCTRCGATSSGNSYIKKGLHQDLCPPKFTRESLNDIQIQALEVQQNMSPHYYEEDAIAFLLESGEVYCHFLLNAKEIENLVKIEELSDKIYLGHTNEIQFHYNPNLFGDLVFGSLRVLDSKLAKLGYTIGSIEIQELEPYIEGNIESGFSAEIDNPEFIITLEPIKE